jgi:hypothetical protein
MKVRATGGFYATDVGSKWYKQSTLSGRLELVRVVCQFHFIF